MRSAPLVGRLRLSTCHAQDRRDHEFLAKTPSLQTLRPNGHLPGQLSRLRIKCPLVKYGQWRLCGAGKNWATGGVGMWDRPVLRPLLDRRESPDPLPVVSSLARLDHRLRAGAPAGSSALPGAWGAVGHVVRWEDKRCQEPNRLFNSCSGCARPMGGLADRQPYTLSHLVTRPTNGVHLNPCCIARITT